MLPDTEDATFFRKIEMYKSSAYGDAMLKELGFPDVPGFEVLRDTPTNNESLNLYMQAAFSLDNILDSLADEKIAKAYRLLEERLEEKFKLARESDGQTRDMFSFFNELKCRARYEHWQQLPFWMFDECVALSLGKEPKFVSSKTLRLEGGPPSFHSPFRNLYKSRLDILNRSNLGMISKSQLGQQNL